MPKGESSEPQSTRRIAFGGSELTLSTESILGRTSVLPCDIVPEDPLEQVATVLWYKGPKGEPIFTYDARGSHNATTWSELPPRGFGTRATFDPHSVPATLSLRQIRAEEAGLYRCRVDFRKSKTRNAFVNLTVVVPPGPPKIISASGREAGEEVGPYDEGAQLKLTCISSGAIPRPTLIWKLGVDVVDSTFESTHSNAVQNTLVLPILTRNHYGRRYSCSAFNNNVTTPGVTTVTINMQLLPRSVHIVNPEEPLSVSRSAILECRSVGSRPPATITWWRKSGKFMGKAPVQIIREGNESVSVSRIEFQPKMNDHQKEITCRSENTKIRGSAIEDTIKLVVHYPPKVQLTFGQSLNPDDIGEGNDVYLECKIKANPSAYKIMWQQNDLRLTDGAQGVRILSGGQSLVLQGVRRSHSGNYTCTAFNLEGQETSGVAMLKIKYKPECLQLDPTTIGVALKQEAQILCPVRSYPPSVSFRWTFNHSTAMNDVPPQQYSFNDTHSLLSYKAESPRDFGIVQCWARNEIGETDRPCVFHLIPAGPPDPPRDCDVLNHTTMGLTVKCESGFSGGLHQLFHMEVRDRETAELLQNQTNQQPVFIIRGFKARRGVNLYLYASNSHGRSLNQIHLETSPSKVAELQIETPTSTDDTGLPMAIIGIAIGIVATLIILATTVFVFIRWRMCIQQQQQQQQQIDKDRSPDKPSALKRTSSQDPDLIPLQHQTGIAMSAPRLQHTQRRAYLSEYQGLICADVTGRPPPPSLRTALPKQQPIVKVSDSQLGPLSWSSLQRGNSIEGLLDDQREFTGHHHAAL